MIDISWTPELITRIYNEKMGWIVSANLPDEEHDAEVAKLNEWKEKVTNESSSAD
jgi:hypothetical protein